jgi:protein-disulfide isomerase
MKRTARQVRKAEARRSQRRRTKMIYAGVAGVLAAALVIVVGMSLRTGSDTPQRDGLAEGRVLGPDLAPVTILAFEDFQCPACKAANESFVQRLERDYVETGIAQLRFKHFPFLGDESLWAAEASECAAEQHMFWQYHDELFARQAGENRGAFSKANLKSIAGKIGLDRAAFEACVDGGHYAAAIKAEKAEAERLGVKQTPTFFINGRLVADWRRYEDVQKLIDAATAGR